MVKRYDLWMYYDEWQEDECDDGDWVKYDDHAAELATLRAENDLLRSIIHRANEQVPSSVWTWHEDANEALK